MSGTIRSLTPYLGSRECFGKVEHIFQGKAGLACFCVRKGRETMINEGDEVRRKSTEIRLGEPLDMLSVEELSERIKALEAEIERVQSALKARQGSMAAAEKLFRR
ncbi:DUF1192 domain-containing protein [Rhodoligotrophos ferricapiens]|uniref:DUF1192 domain-containing protein n=1 Tax=Rhodoligotrophos ferricapiens TaxID=3069264 RepID=UPI00315DF74C